MQISFSPELLAVTLEDDSNTFYHLQNVIEKNFSKRIGRKNKTIVFKQEEEDVQRRYFLKLIDKMYRRKNRLFCEKTSEQIRVALDKTIKITLLKSNQLQQHLKITMNIEDNYAVIFDIGSRNSILVSYLRNYFKNHLLKYRLKNQTVILYPHSSNTAQLLEKLLEQTEIIGCYVDFSYDLQEFNTYKNSLTRKTNRRKNYNALFSILEEFYEILGCKEEDSFNIIRKSYLKLVKQYHPDRLSHASSSLTSHYTDKFQIIQHAYEMIKVHFEHEKSA